MSDNSRPMSLPRFRRNTARPGCFCMLHRCPRRTALAMWDRLRLRWIDQLHDAGQSWWQSLPLGPTGYGNSPYQSMSSFAGNGLLISPDWLIEDGLLRASDCALPCVLAKPPSITAWSCRSNAGCLR